MSLEEMVYDTGTARLTYRGFDSLRDSIKHSEEFEFGVRMVTFSVLIERYRDMLTSDSLTVEFMLQDASTTGLSAAAGDSCYDVMTDSRAYNFTSLLNSHIRGSVYKTADFLFTPIPCDDHEGVFTTPTPLVGGMFFTPIPTGRRVFLSVVLTVHIIEPLTLNVMSSGSEIRVEVGNVEEMGGGEISGWRDLNLTCCLNNIDLTTLGFVSVRSDEERGDEGRMVIVQLNMGCSARVMEGAVRCRAVRRTRTRGDGVSERDGVIDGVIGGDSVTRGVGLLEYWSDEHYYNKPASLALCHVPRVRISDTETQGVFNVSWACLDNEDTNDQYTVHIRGVNTTIGRACNYTAITVNSSCSYLTQGEIVTMTNSVSEIWVTGGDNKLIADKTSLYFPRVSSVTVTRLAHDICDVTWDLTRYTSRNTEDDGDQIFINLGGADSEMINVNSSQPYKLANCNETEVMVTLRQCNKLALHASRDNSCVTVWSERITVTKQRGNELTLQRNDMIAITVCSTVLTLMLVLVVYCWCRYGRQRRSVYAEIDLNMHDMIGADMDSEIVIMHIKRHHTYQEVGEG